MFPLLPTSLQPRRRPEGQGKVATLENHTNMQMAVNEGHTRRENMKNKEESDAEEDEREDCRQVFYTISLVHYNPLI